MKQFLWLIWREWKRNKRDLIKSQLFIFVGAAAFALLFYVVARTNAEDMVPVSISKVGGVFFTMFLVFEVIVFFYASMKLQTNIFYSENEVKTMTFIRCLPASPACQVLAKYCFNTLVVVLAFLIPCLFAVLIGYVLSLQFSIELGDFQTGEPAGVFRFVMSILTPGMLKGFMFLSGYFLLFGALVNKGKPFSIALLVLFLFNVSYASVEQKLPQIQAVIADIVSGPYFFPILILWNCIAVLIAIRIFSRREILSK